MNPQPASPPPEFDRHVGVHDPALLKKPYVSGGGKNYYGNARASWLAECLRQLGFSLASDQRAERGTAGRVSPFGVPPSGGQHAPRNRNRVSAEPQTGTVHFMPGRRRGNLRGLSAGAGKRSVQSILDYGCGIGSATPSLAECLGFKSFLGVDVSPQSLETARRAHGSEQVRFLAVDEYLAAGRMDLAFCNGAFRRIEPDDRADAVDVVYRSLAPGGIFSFWENNPWNPGARYVMSRNPFDSDSLMLHPAEAQLMLNAGGFEIVRTDFHFIFPRALGWFRRFERRWTSIPLGAQYQILCRKPR